MLVRWTPFTETDHLSQAMNRLFDGRTEDSTSVTWSPAIDVAEDREKITLTADVPGLAEKDLDIQIEKDTLVVRGSRTIERSGDADHYRRFERASGTFVRSFTLPPSVDPESVSAHLQHGVLMLTLPKKPEAQPKKITVKIAH